jgi:hypothetical protein
MKRVKVSKKHGIVARNNTILKEKTLRLHKDNFAYNTFLSQNRIMVRVFLMQQKLLKPLNHMFALLS